MAETALMKMAHQVIVDYKPEEAELTSFNPFQVELLLNQAADLLDRVLNTNSRYEALRVQELQQAMSITQLQNEISTLESMITTDMSVGDEPPGPRHSECIH
jgi:hypothetical protein